MQWKKKLKLQALKPLGINLKNKKKINFTKKIVATLKHTKSFLNP